MNLFIELHELKFGTDERRFGTGWENLFTEQFAFFLEGDLPAAGAVARLLLSRDATVTGVSTQAASGEGIPDLQFKLTDGTCLHVEHKFDAPLEATQLQRYSRLGFVALVSRCSQSIPDDVLQHVNYCRPPERHYFHWEDIYTAVSTAVEPPAGFGGLRDHFLGYMRELGLAPTNLKAEWRRLLDKRPDAEGEKVQKDFGRLLDAFKAEMKRRGYAAKDNTRAGKEVHAPPGRAWLHLYVYPARARADYMDATHAKAFDPGYESLMIDFVFDSDQEHVARDVYRQLGEARADSDGHVWYPVRPRPIAGKN